MAQFVREMNAALWAPDVADQAAPELLVGEPIVAQHFQSADQRCWVRVYLDGSALDQTGNVQLRAAGAVQHFDSRELA
jgi:hypothetical protein